LQPELGVLVAWWLK